MLIKQDSAWELNEGLALGPQIHRILRERIVTNDLLPGRKISESEIARDYGISRQPVREALIKLSEEGLIKIRPQRGTTVSKIDYSAVLDARFVREAIEADIVRLLTERPKQSLVEDLRRQLDEQNRVAKEAPLQFIQLDEQFHRTLAEAADKAKAWNFIEELKSQMDRVRFLSLSHFPIDKLISQHTAVVDGIEARDPDRAVKSIRTHLREILSDLPQIQKGNPAFFDDVVTRSDSAMHIKLEEKP